jgi:hypothetical protein
MANDYITTTQAKAVMPDDTFSTSYDSLLTATITRASRSIDKYTGRHPGAYAVSSTETRYYDGSGCEYLWIDELATTTGLSVSVAEGGVVDTYNGTGGTYTAWTSTDFRVYPYNAPKLGQPFLRLDIDRLNGSKALFFAFPNGVKVSGYFGYAYTTAPDAIIQATITQTMRYFQRGKQAFRDAGAVVELGQLQYLQSVDPDVAEMIRYYKVTGVS